MVLEGLAVLWPGRPSQVPTVCHWHIQGSPAGFCCSGGHERHPEVSDPPWRSLHWPPAICSYLVKTAILQCINNSTTILEGTKSNDNLMFSLFWPSALTSWTSQLMRAMRSWDICCCWPFRNVQRDLDWLKLWDSKHTQTCIQTLDLDLPTPDTFTLIIFERTHTRS